MVPLVILVGLFLQYPLRSVVERSQREASQKHALLVETIDGLETIKATAAEGRVQKSWERFVGLSAASSGPARSEEHTSELQSLMRISYAVSCLKKTQNHPT